MSDAALNRTRPFFWSVRRELWETRSIVLAPLAVSAVILIGFLFSTVGMPARRLEVLKLDPIHQAMVIGQPYAFAHAAITGVMLLVAWFYCLDALYSERKDRSILFWKSLPVSDRTTVLAKMTVPMAAVPIVVYAVTVVVEAAILLLSTIILAASGVPTASPWSAGDIAAQGVVLGYSLVALSLWQAPVYAWFILVSAWAKKAPFLWGVLPPLAICLVEKLAFDTARFGHLLLDRLGGSEDHAMVKGAGFMVRPGMTPTASGLAAMDPGGFLATPGLWIGWVVAVAFLAAAIWLRRRGEPI